MENTKETSGKTEKTVVVIQPSNFHLVQESYGRILELGHYLRLDELSILEEIQEATKSAINRNFVSEIRYFKRWIYDLPEEQLLDFYTTLSGEIERKEKEPEAKKKDEAEMQYVSGSLPDLIRKLFGR